MNLKVPVSAVICAPSSLSTRALPKSVSFTTWLRLSTRLSAFRSLHPGHQASRGHTRPEEPHTTIKMRSDGGPTHQCVKYGLGSLAACLALTCE